MPSRNKPRGKYNNRTFRPEYKTWLGIRARCCYASATGYED